MIGVRSTDAADDAVHRLRDKPRLTFNVHQALAVVLLLVAALGISLTLLIQQSMHLAALSNVAVETPNNANATQQRPQSSSDSDEMTDVEPDPEQLPETQTDENSAVTVDDGLVDINTAGLAELQTITGVGPVTAQRIIDYRKTIGRYASVDQLLGVKGIGSKTLEKIRGQVTVR